MVSTIVVNIDMLSIVTSITENNIKILARAVEENREADINTVANIRISKQLEIER